MPLPLELAASRNPLKQASLPKTPMSEPAPFPTWAIPLIAVVFPIFFVSLWCFASLVVSTFSGWRKLALLYPATASLIKPDTVHRMVTAKMGASRYKGSLTVGFSPEGMHLSVMVLFRLGHPPLFIPWSEFYHFQAHRFLGFESVSCEIGSPNITTLTLPRRILVNSPASPVLPP